MFQYQNFNIFGFFRKLFISRSSGTRMILSFMLLAELLLMRVSNVPHRLAIYFNSMGTDIFYFLARTTSISEFSEDFIPSAFTTGF